MANKDAVGTEGAPFTMPIERGKIREFARATGGSHGDYIDEASPPIPPTFLATTAFWQPPEGNVFRALEIDVKRLLHGGQEYVFFGPPPRAGSELTATSRVESVSEKEGKRGGTMTFAVVTTDFRDAGGGLVAQARSTLIETGRAPE